MAEVEGEGGSRRKERRCRCRICRLPSDVLVTILSHLSVLDYIYFLAVCKCWRSAFLNCSKIIFQDKAYKRPPWFLILSSKQAKRPIGHSSVVKPSLYATGKFGDLSTGRIYTADIPELCGTRVLLSKYGWLLLFSSEGKSHSLFFFNVFSRAKISLPSFDVAGLDRPVLGVSAPPTAPDCTVFAICCDSSCGYRISLCRRKDNAWRAIQGCKWEDKGPVVNVFFTNNKWYCLHHYGDISTFDAVSCCLKFLGNPIGTGWIGVGKNVSYAIRRRGKLFLRIHGVRTFEINLDDPPKAYLNGPLDEGWLRTDSKRAIMQLQSLAYNQLEVDSFSADAWCSGHHSDGSMRFQWHEFQSWQDDLLVRRHECKTCLPGRKQQCSANIMWFEPAWVDSSHAINWAL